MRERLKELNTISMLVEANIEKVTGAKQEQEVEIANCFE